MLQRVAFGQVLEAVDGREPSPKPVALPDLKHLLARAHTAGASPAPQIVDGGTSMSLMKEPCPLTSSSPLSSPRWKSAPTRSRAWRSWRAGGIPCWPGGTGVFARQADAAECAVAQGAHCAHTAKGAGARQRFRAGGLKPLGCRVTDLDPGTGSVVRAAWFPT